jgi:Ca2+-binding RTX toxin-like protein
VVDNALECAGRPATIVGHQGSHAALVGTPERDVIVGGAGQDALTGLAGPDWLCSGAEDDALEGGTGDDVFVGGGGIDTVEFSDSANTVLADLSVDAPEGPFATGEGSDAQAGVENLVGTRRRDQLNGDE